MTSADIKLLAIDLDGTLLDSRKQIDAETVAALKAVVAGGRPVVIASARPPRSVRPIYDQLGLSTLTVNYNGALIWNEAERLPFFHKPMAAELVGRVVAAAREMFAHVQVSCEILDQWYTDRHDPKHTTETGRMFPPDVVTPLAKFAHLDVTKLMLLGEPAMVRRLEREIAEAFSDHLTVIRTDDDLIQIMDKRVSKAVSVERVARHYGVEMENVMAIGDAPNDYAMVATAGLGIAMGNAHPLIQDVAKWTAPSNDERGVLAALRQFGLA